MFCMMSLLDILSFFFLAHSMVVYCAYFRSKSRFKPWAVTRIPQAMTDSRSLEQHTIIFKDNIRGVIALFPETVRTIKFD